MIETSHKAEEILEEIINNTDSEATIAIEEDADGLHVDLRGDNLGILIGKDGKTLEAIEFILNIAINKGQEERTKLFLDIEGYKSKKNERLEENAKQAATKVEETQQPLSLEPMNPYERRIIHLALKENTAIQTESVGEEPNRYIVIKPL